MRGKGRDEIVVFDGERIMQLEVMEIWWVVLINSVDIENLGEGTDP